MGSLKPQRFLWSVDTLGVHENQVKNPLFRVKQRALTLYRGIVFITLYCLVGSILYRWRSVTKIARSSTLLNRFTCKKKKVNHNISSRMRSNHLPGKHLGAGTRPSRTNTPKRCPFHYRGLECKSRKSRDSWNKREIWPWSTKRSRAKANRVLPRDCTGHSKHPLSTTQEKTLHMDITRWSILKSDWLYSLQPKIEKLYTVSKNKTGSWLWLRSWTPYCQIQT